MTVNENDFSVDGKEFKLSKLDVFVQAKIAKRLLPVFGDIMPIAKELNDLQQSGKEPEAIFDIIAKKAKPLLETISRLPDEDTDKLLLWLCSAVEVKQQPAGNWARIARGDSFMIQNLDFPTLMKCAGRAFMFNLADFFRIAPQVSHGKQ